MIDRTWTVFTINQLRVMMASRGLTFRTRWRKAQYVAALSEYETPEQTQRRQARNRRKARRRALRLR
jgi:hypothetical protein